MNVIDYQLRRGHIRNKETLKTEAGRTIRMLIITLGIMIAVLSVTSLFGTGQSAQKGYTLEQLKRKNQELKNDQSELGAKINNSTSFNKLSDNEKIAEMQKSEIKNFVTEEDNRVK